MAKNPQVPAVVHAASAALLNRLEQGQEKALELSSSLKRGIDRLPFPSLPRRPRGVPTLEATTKFGFDLASEVINHQRDFALRLGRILSSKN
jgi:hypothetical protein